VTFSRFRLNLVSRQESAWDEKQRQGCSHNADSRGSPDLTLCVWQKQVMETRAFGVRVRKLILTVLALLRVGFLGRSTGIR
jgi:hypothetical protein